MEADWSVHREPRYTDTPGAGQSRMSGGTTVPEDRALSPDDWPHPAERRYADAQARLADHYDLAVEPE